MRVIAREIVLLPAPVLPTIPIFSPAFTLKVMLEKRRNKQKETGTGPFKRRGSVLIFEAQ